MCTLSVIQPAAGALRLAFNRDELYTRPPALPPRVVHVGERAVILPIDPQSGGTWIAVSDAGLAFAVLNVNPPERGVHRFPQSRGRVIGGLLDCYDLAQAVSRAERIDRSNYPPFRLVVADRREVVSLTDAGSDRRDVTGDLPLMFTSSSLGDHVVEPPRRALFEADPPRSAAEQDALHGNRWPDRPHLSVCMTRADAATVSYTVVEIDRRRVALKYLGHAPPSPDALEQHRYEQYHFHSCAVPLAVAPGRVCVRRG
jgi:hypothetical protein